VKPRRLARRVVYESSWLNLYLDRVKLPGGRIVEEHHLIDFERPAVATVVENAAGEILLIHSYRYTTGSIEWEVPAGKVEKGESVLAAAKREAREESGYDTRAHRLVYSYHPLNGLSNALFHVTRCVATGRRGRFDPNEVEKIRWATRKQVVSMIRNRRIRDGFSLTSLLLVLSGPAFDAARPRVRAR
jgi:ADP-ribose pyrophosphatase